VTEPAALDKRQVRTAFGRAAPTYDGAARLQHDLAEQLVERLDVVRFTPRDVLDLGCGTGYGAARLARRFPQARIVALDVAEGMVRRARDRTGGWRRFLPRTFVSPRVQCLCADAETLPLAAASVDLVVSSLMLQWCDARTVFAQVQRVLRPGGLWLFSTFGPDTLKELRAAWRAVDESVHVHDFVDMHDLGDLLVGLGFADPVMDVERYTLHYPDVIEALRDLKRIGAHNIARQRARGLTGKEHFARFRAAYEAQARDGRIPVSYEAVFGLAWTPATVRMHGDTATIPVERIGRRA
jgi:malonyl-CoA O-methyltransferase